MTTYAQAIVDKLTADATLMALLTGKVWNYPISGRKGMNRTQMPDAFDSVTGLIKPCCVVLELNESPTGEAIDATSGYMSTIVPIWTWIYDDGDHGYATIDAAYNRIYSLLNMQPLAGAFQVLWKGAIKDKREPDLSDASYYRADWRVHGFRTF